MNARLPPISPETLHKLLRYDPESGRLTWRWRTAEVYPERFAKGIRRMESWNSHYAGLEALRGVSRPGGYLTGTIFGIRVRAHRVIWAMVNGFWPMVEVDHIDGDKMNNRISNLRLAGKTENMRNMPIPKTNTSGILGVGKNFTSSGRLRWTATIRENGRAKHLGYFDTAEQAKAARKDAERRLGFHPNHGRAAERSSRGGVSDFHTPSSDIPGA